MQDDDQGDVRPSWTRLLFLFPYAAVLWVPFYNTVEPSFWGIPFFYTWQLGWTVLCAVVIGIVYFIEG